MHELGFHRVIFLKLILKFLLAMSFVLGASVATATKPKNITEAEMKLLPRYCADTMGFNYGDAYTDTSPRAGHWVSLMGKGFWAMHHYCWAQINLPRAQRSGVSANFRQGTLENVRGDYQFVLEHTSADFIMRPEVLSRLGEVELILANPEGANSAFAKARELKPDYWPAYSHWAEYLIRSGKRMEAKQLLKTGLEYSPTAKVLLEQYRLVGGNPSEIVPRPKVLEPESPAQEPVQATAKEQVPDQVISEASPNTKVTEQ